MQIGRLFVLIVLTVSAFLKVWKGFRHFYSLLKSYKDWRLLEWIGSRREFIMRMLGWPLSSARGMAMTEATERPPGSVLQAFSRRGLLACKVSGLRLIGIVRDAQFPVELRPDIHVPHGQLRFIVPPLVVQGFQQQGQLCFA